VTPADDLVMMRRMLAALFLAGSVGTGVELLLLEHVEELRQQIPLFMIGLGSVALAALSFKPARATLRAFRATAGAFMLSGVVGVWFHYRANVEFELELQPDASGFHLFSEAMTGAMPALAPGTMILLGALGLTSTYRHPAGRAPRSLDSFSKEHVP
jgi:hypothetical protein